MNSRKADGNACVDAGGEFAGGVPGVVSFRDGPTVKLDGDEHMLTVLAQALDMLRTSANGGSNRGPLKVTHMHELDQVAARHFRETQAPTLAVGGRHVPLLIRLASSLVSAPHHFALLVIDLEGRFDATRLTCEAADARHIYVHRPSLVGDPEEEDSGDGDGNHVRALLAEAEKFMLYGSGAAASAGRMWWGTFVLGGLGAGDVVADWRGWLKVSREHVDALTPGLSAEEALGHRNARQEAVDAASWMADSHWGRFSFREDDV